MRAKLAGCLICTLLIVAGYSARADSVERMFARCETAPAPANGQTACRSEWNRIKARNGGYVDRDSLTRVRVDLSRGGGFCDFRAAEFVEVASGKRHPRRFAIRATGKSPLGPTGAVGVSVCVYTVVIRPYE
jgi:hypothetical protein